MSIIAVNVLLFFAIAALRPVALYPYMKAKETHGLIFSWLLWLVVLLVGAYAHLNQSKAN